MDHAGQPSFDTGFSFGFFTGIAFVALVVLAAWVGRRLWTQWRQESPPDAVQSIIDMDDRHNREDNHTVTDPPEYNAPAPPAPSQGPVIHDVRWGDKPYHHR